MIVADVGPIMAAAGPRMRFMIKADDQWFEAVIAHFA
jgi:hypothetical protein